LRLICRMTASISREKETAYFRYIPPVLLLVEHFRLEYICRGVLCNSTWIGLPGGSPTPRFTSVRRDSGARFAFLCASEQKLKLDQGSKIANPMVITSVESQTPMPRSEGSGLSSAAFFRSGNSVLQYTSGGRWARKRQRRHADASQPPVNNLVFFLQNRYCVRQRPRSCTVLNWLTLYLIWYY